MLLLIRDVELVQGPADLVHIVGNRQGLKDDPVVSESARETNINSK